MFMEMNDKAGSPENITALMAPENRQSPHLQRMKDSCLRRMCRLINEFGKVREGILQKRC